MRPVRFGGPVDNHAHDPDLGCAAEKAFGLVAQPRILEVIVRVVEPRLADGWTGGGLFLETARELENALPELAEAVPAVGAQVSLDASLRQRVSLVGEDFRRCGSAKEIAEQALVLLQSC